MSTRTTRKPKPTRKPVYHHTANPIAEGAEFIGRLQAAALIGVNVQTIDLAIRQERLPAYRVGRRVLVSRTDVIKLVVGNPL
jgi:excisionase family DNA binding protein